MITPQFCFYGIAVFDFYTKVKQGQSFRKTEKNRANGRYFLKTAKIEADLTFIDL